MGRRRKREIEEERGSWEVTKRIRKKYFNKVNGKLVRIRFSDTDKTAEDCLTRVLENLYR